MRRDDTTEAAADDEDVAALLAAQAKGLAPPPALDAAIRAVARARTVSARTDEARDAVARDDPAVLAGRRRTSAGRRAPRWLAAAAVVTLAVALLPQLRRSPPPEALPAPATEAPAGLTTGASPPSAVAMESADERAERRLQKTGAIRHEAVVPMAEVAETAEVTVDDAATAAGDADALSDVAPRARAPATPSATSAGIARSAVPPAEPAHRATPERWLAWLRERLREDGPSATLREEYRLLRERHPDVAARLELLDGTGDAGD